MRSYDVFQHRQSRRRHLEWQVDKQTTLATNKMREADRLEQECNALRTQLDETQRHMSILKSAIFGDLSVETRVVRRILAIDDREAGEMPCVSVRFKRLGFANNDWHNISHYECELVLPRYAMFTRMHSGILFNSIREVLDFATTGVGAK